MERRYELRLEQMLAQAEVSPELMRGLFKRLAVWLIRDSRVVISASSLRR